MLGVLNITPREDNYASPVLVPICFIVYSNVFNIRRYPDDLIYPFSFNTSCFFCAFEDINTNYIHAKHKISYNFYSIYQILFIII